MSNSKTDSIVLSHYDPLMKNLSMSTHFPKIDSLKVGLAEVNSITKQNFSEIRSISLGKACLTQQITNLKTKG
jgi:hypothetical protein